MNSENVSVSNAGESRRGFIKKAATAAAGVAAANVFRAPVYGQSQAPSANVLGANDRIAVGYIGTGSQGSAHIRYQKASAGDNRLVQAAVCDVYEKRLDKARDTIGLSSADAYKDHRKLLERNDIDAVIVCTVDNWHADVAIDALEAGKHVYGEKPMTRYLGEAFRLYDTVKRTGKVFQLGTQGCADKKYHESAKWIKEGRIGPLVWSQGSYCRNNWPRSEWTYPIETEASPENLDWYRWLGKAPKIPFNPEHYFSWHKFYAYNSGILGNLLPHRVVPLLMATGTVQFPRRVVCTGTRAISTDREITDTTHLLAEFPSGLTMVVAGSTVNEQGLPDILRGHKATLYFASSQNRVELKPERAFADEIDPDEFSSPEKVESVPALEKNFFDCIRTGETPYANVELAIRGQTVLCLAEMSERLGLALYFNEKSRTARTGDGREVPFLDYESNAPRTT